MKQLQQNVYYLLLFYLIISGLYFAAEFLIPVALAAVFTMLFMGVSNWFEKQRVPRALSALFSVFIFIAVVVAIVLLLSWQLSGMTDNIDAMKERSMEIFNQLRQWVSQTLGIDYQQQEKLVKQQGDGATGQAGGVAAVLASGLMGFLVNTILTVVYMYLLLYYRNHLKKFLLKMVPAKDGPNTETIVQQSAEVARLYLSGTAVMIVMLWVLYGIGFNIVGLEGAIFFAILCGTLEIVPFIGNLTGTAIAVLAALAQGGDSRIIIGVIVVYLTVQFVQTYIIEPLVVGEQVNINPLFTIMGLVIGEMVWGIAGMVLAIPALGILKIICDHLPGLQPYGFLIGTVNKGRKSPSLINKMKKWF